MSLNNLRGAPIFMVFVLLLCGGCIKESPCVPDRTVPVTLVFRYDHHFRTGDLFPDQVNSLDIMVYDAEGKITGMRSVRTADIGVGNTVTLTLPEGDHSFVVWGNFTQDHFTYDTGNTGHFAESSLRVNSESDGTVEIHSATLFHGMASATIAGPSVTVPVPLIKDTNIIRIYLAGLDPSARADAATDLYVRIEGCNGHYDFANASKGSDMLTYVPRYDRVNTGVLSAEMTVMRLFSDDDLVLRIEDRGNTDNPVIYSDPLTDIIFSRFDHVNTDEDLDREDEYEITFLLERRGDGTWMLGGIYSGDWNNIDMGEGIK